MNTFENERRRVSVSLLPVMAQVFDAPPDTLVANNTVPAITSEPKKRGPQRRIRQQLEQIEALPLTEQRIVSQMIDAMLQANASG